ncbi:hypothetical protein [Neorhizobium vignae]|uniref:hypothetical protein n=1 Tax=Neorhizobium vignae TaxID=690585 RepID=UPI000A04F20B|nr:hypothetical protein [Neorhizobium vignae]
MKITTLTTLAVLTGCSAATSTIAPIPGSITYGGQPSTRLTKSPIGSQVSHGFRDPSGVRWEETYLIQPDRTLRLVNRRRISIPDD